MYAHRLNRKMAEIRKGGGAPWMRPDCKSQVAVNYDGDKVVEIVNVVISTQHAFDVSHAEIERFCIDEVIKKVLPAELISNSEFLINPTGRFVVGGPQGDAGLTGRKIIVDTYGGSGRHGGGAFSGKDPSKVDRSAAYMCRWVAKNIVAAGLANRVELQVGYAIGHPEPTSVTVETFGTNLFSEDAIEELFERCSVSSPLILSLSLIYCVPSIVLPPTMDTSLKTTSLGKTLQSQMTSGHRSANPFSANPLHTPTKMSIATESALDYKVSDISLAEFGRKRNPNC